MTNYEQEPEQEEVYTLPFGDQSFQYVVNNYVAVIVAGNGLDWEPDAYVWLPSQVAYELDEAGALEIQFNGEQQPGKYGGDPDSELSVFVFHLSGGY